MFLCYGGGISSTLEIRKLLKCFADKICLNNSILKNRNLLINSIKIFGSQCIVASVDIIKNKKNDYFVYDTKNKKITKLDPIKYCSELSELGVGEIGKLVNNDGAKTIWYWII